MTIPYGSEFVVVHTLVATHRAFIKAGPAAVGFWTGALAYTRHERLDGWVPEEALSVILGLNSKESRRLAEALVAAGLMTRDEKRGGFIVLRYAEMGNETNEEIDTRLAKAEAERTRERERKAALRAAHRQSDGTFGPRPASVPPDNAGTGMGQAPDGATPVQPQTEQSRAEQSRSKNKQHSTAATLGAETYDLPPKPTPPKRGTRITSDWKPSPEVLEWARGQGIDAMAHVAEFVDHWLGVAGAKGVKLDWDATYRNRLRALDEQGRAARSSIAKSGSVPVAAPYEPTPEDLAEAERIGREASEDLFAAMRGKTVASVPA